jgi:vacuolar-type H+-ATPase subunit I/STV1
MNLMLLLQRTMLFLALVIGAAGLAQAQQKTPPPRPRANPVSADKNSNRPDSDIMVGSPEAEMMARQEIKAARKDYEENLERAREAAQLSTELRDAYLQNKVFGRTEQKKLERLEKITRKIRSEAGGSDGDTTLENVPMQIEPALTRLTEVSEKMRDGVEKTPRQVVSASVIERANELLEVIRFIRTYTR